MNRIEEVSMAGGNTCVPYRRSINGRRLGFTKRVIVLMKLLQKARTFRYI